MIGTRQPAGAGQRGFTLMEMLVALGLFSMVLAAATDIYLMAGRTQRKAFSMERLAADARFALEAVVREARTGEIDYGYYDARGTALGGAVTELALVSPDGTALRFFESGEGTARYCVDEASAPCLLVAVDGGTPAAVTPRGVQVASLAFYVRPIADPFTWSSAPGDYGSDDQPRVTAVLYLRSAAERLGEDSAVYLQTTVTSRLYRR
jgi:prepilin-type N-terminal cleavage/methylation domain-containing protein